MAEQNKSPSSLVRAVTSLDGYFSELERIGHKISEMDLRSDFDFEQIQKLMNRFAECGEGVATEVTALSNDLNNARTRADEVAKAVAEKALILATRREERSQKMESFRILGEKVRDLTATLTRFQRSEGQKLSESERSQLKLHLKTFETELEGLVSEARQLRKEAQDARMKSLEQNADALTQTLQSIQKKIKTMDLVPEGPELLL